MALWADYSLATVGTDLQVTVRWRTTQNGAVFQTDVTTYSLTDRAVIGNDGLALAPKVVADFNKRAQVINTGVAAYTAVQTALGANQNTVFQVI